MDMDYSGHKNGVLGDRSYSGNMGGDAEDDGSLYS